MPEMEKEPLRTRIFGLLAYELSPFFKWAPLVREINNVGNCRRSLGPSFFRQDLHLLI